MPQQLADVREPVNTLYYGEGGTGKTTHLALMSRLGKVWMVNAESGIKSRPLRERGAIIDNIEIYPDPKQGEELTFAGLESEWLRIREALHNDPEAYVGTSWDSITEIYKALLDTVIVQGVAKAARAGRERDPFMIEQSDYGIMTEQVRSLVRKFRDLPCHFAMSALARRQTDDDGSVVYNPAITPALQNDLIGWMDMVCVTSVAQVDGEDEYRGLFRPHGKYRGKDRLGAMPKWLVDPTFDRVIGYVEGDLDVDSDPVMQEARERFARQKAKEDPDSAGTESEPAAAAA